MKKTISLFILCFIGIKIFAQIDEKNWTKNIQSEAIATSNDQIPFWLRSNKFGSIPLKGLSSSITGTISKRIAIQDTTKWYENKWNWGLNFEARANFGNNTQFKLIEASLNARYNVFDLKIGRAKEMMGLCDSTLSTGAFAISGNALGIPKVDLRIPEYWIIPIFNDVFALKGNFAFGYLGDVNIGILPAVFDKYTKTYYHQKSLYGRIGKQDAKTQVFLGFNHQVFYGNEREFLGPDFELGGLSELYYVVFGQSYKNRSVVRSKVGNHGGSIDQAVKIDLEKSSLYFYHQFFYEVGGLAHLNNLKDGLFGLAITNKSFTKSNKSIKIQKFLFEFLSSKDQGGEIGDKITPSGDENYYNNYVYREGWSYKGENLGNPLLTNQRYLRKDLPQRQYFANNRVYALNFGIMGSVYKWHVTSKLTYSKNFGAYSTSRDGSTTGGDRFFYPPPYFPTVNQFSGYLEANRPLKKNFNIGLTFATDYGDLLYNSAGVSLKLSKQW